MVSFHVLYFWQRGIRKLELERTKFGKFASQGTNNSRSWKFKFERVLGRKIYLHGRHIFFFFFPSSHFRTSSLLKFSIFDIVLRNTKRALLQATLFRSSQICIENSIIYSRWNRYLPRRNLDASHSKYRRIRYSKIVLVPPFKNLFHTRRLNPSA